MSTSRNDLEEKFKALARIVMRNEGRLDEASSRLHMHMEREKNIVGLIKGISNIQTDLLKRVKELEKEI